VGPDDFIGVAEDTGMIVQIGHQILVESCTQMATWRQQFGAGAPEAICVNLSSRQFADTDLARTIEEVLEQTGLPASSLKLEITESAFIGDVEAAQATLRRLSAIGVEWSLDDFGTGYSSLSHLHKLQVNTLKIDRSFVGRMDGNEEGLEMVRAIIALARNLSMDVVAEGVESEGQFTRLRTLGCESAQGFHFSRPIDPAAAARLIASQPWSLPAVSPSRSSTAVFQPQRLPTPL
jgi:EAL domain-containing protein (putative c-di-GMP-specific phosphodiesterase class I)